MPGIGDRTTSLANDLDYDLLSGDIRASGAQGVRGIKRKPGSDSGNGPGRFWLARGSPGYDAGVRIPSFNDDFSGKALDVGAHEAGAPAMESGIKAHDRGSRGGPSHAKDDGAPHRNVTR